MQKREMIKIVQIIRLAEPIYLVFDRDDKTFEAQESYFIGLCNDGKGRALDFMHDLGWLVAAEETSNFNCTLPMLGPSWEEKRAENGSKYWTAKSLGYSELRPV